MGNYYQGTITIRLKNDLTKDVEDFLKWLSGGLQEKSLNDFPLFKNHEYFKKKNYNYPIFEYGKLVKWNDEECFFSYDEDIRQYNIKTSDITGRYLKININMKAYNNQMECFLELIRPYIDESAPNYIGEIHDEDGRYRKCFYTNENILLKEIKEREILCGNCEWNRPLTLCDSYSRCKRAYDIGREKRINKLQESYLKHDVT